jgi:Glycosyltransferase WbsX
MPTLRLSAYVYPGWHAIPERDAAFYPGFTEWDLVEQCRPRFARHAQPRLPAWGRYDDRDPVAVSRTVRAAADHGVDMLTYGFFWCRGKRVFQDALDLGFLPAATGMPFALMWANRMPRRVLPVARPEADVIDPARLVSSDVDDFVALIAYLAERYFHRDDYVRDHDKPVFSIFDSTFFLRELGLAGAKRAIGEARRWLRQNGLPGLSLAAIDPAPDVAPHLAEVGFDRVTHYVLLPYWKGPSLQDYGTTAAARAAEWGDFAARAHLPYDPSVSPGWDASPRGADFGDKRPDKYPWSPVVVGEHPTLFRDALRRAMRWSGDGTVHIASLNEWSEGHYLEPDTRFGDGWLEAVRDARMLK